MKTGILRRLTLRIYLLKNVLDSAIEDGFIERNVVESKRLSFSKKATERKPLTEDQVADIINKVNELDDRTQLFIKLLRIVLPKNIYL